MNTAVKNLVEGAGTLAVGAALWLVGGDVHVPVIDLDKTGVVVACVGAAQLLYGGYLTAGRASRTRG
ncbi:DUF5708 family protein [Streptomyces sp. SAJ15]|uniref:DUF5708 family protein n=1 Tax=Streptomyces sp. SAJ15 TaxID=2011095 RepID=UPI0011864C34|nr:DUF5708 family protein [Streptomyces sp. SAJ15]TVL89955.1 hypothetical protein CD790_24455 [Streptomyces sp. SAJ15]